MLLHTKEHFDLMAQFEKDFPHLRLDKESKYLWEKKSIYQNGETNKLFIAYRIGYAFGKTV